MEINTLFISASLPSPPLCPFFDQSHVQFYGPVSRYRAPISSFTRQFTTGPHTLAPTRLTRLLAAPSVPNEVADEQDFMKELADLKARLKRIKKASSVPKEVADEQDFMKEFADLKARLKQNQKAPSVPNEVADEQDFMKELADLKARLKQKKKDMKARMKETKKTLKKIKSKDGLSSTASESESESTHREYVPAEMKLIQEEQIDPFQEVKTVSTETGSSDLVQASAIVEGMQSNLSSDSAVCIASGTDSSSSIAKPSKTKGKIEVCVGKSCKTAGSQELLSSLRAQTPRVSTVEAMPCKCMGRCKMSINVRVQKEETNPLYHSHVGTQDAGALLSHHFKLGPPPTGLPDLRPQGCPSAAPQRLTASL